MRSLAVLAPLGLLLVLFLLGSGEPETDADHFGTYSLFPALITLVLVFITREVISSLFFGIVAGGIISGNYNVLDAFILSSIGSSSFAVILQCC